MKNHSLSWNTSAASDLVMEERGGLVAVEAEHFYKQTATDKRAWHVTSSKAAPGVKPDGDAPHVGGVKGGAYIGGRNRPPQRLFLTLPHPGVAQLNSFADISADSGEGADFRLR